MSDLEKYRRPDEIAETRADDARIEAVLVHACDNMTAMAAAMHFGETPAVVELWVDRLHNELRAALSGEDRLRAVLLLLRPTAELELEKLIAGIGGDVR